MLKKRRLFTAVCVLSAAALCINGCSKKAVTNTAGELDKEFIIGEVFSDTGMYASYGISLHSGASMAVKEINANGGVEIDGDNYKLRLISADDESDADRAKNAYHTLIDKGAQAVIGTYSEEGCKAVDKLADEDNILMVIPSSTSYDSDKSDSSFKISMSDVKQGNETAEYAFYQLNCKNAAVIYQEKDAGLAQAFSEKFSSIGGNVCVNEIYNGELSGIDYVLDNIYTAQPDILFIPAEMPLASELLRLVDNRGIRASVIGDFRWHGVTAAQYENILSVQYISSVGDKYLQFSEDYLKEYGNLADLSAAQGYDSVYTVKEALEEAGNVDSDLEICAMTSIQFDGATGNGISFDEDGYSNRDMEFIKLYQKEGSR